MALTVEQFLDRYLPKGPYLDVSTLRDKMKADLEEMISDAVLEARLNETKRIDD